LFDRICAENGIRHLLTAPRSPTTTGKVERWHKTMRGGCQLLCLRREVLLVRAEVRDLCRLPVAAGGWS
jgi:transposase InsO family protein